MVAHLLTIAFKFQVFSLLPSSEGFAEFMGHYSTVFSVSTVVISVLWVVLGAWLLVNKGWRTTALCGALSILVGGVIFFGASAITGSPSWLYQGIYNGTLASTERVLFFPLVQILYLYIPYQARLRAKIVTEMIALPLVTTIPPLVFQGLLVFLPMSTITLYLNIPAVFILMVLLVPTIRSISSKFVDKFSTAAH
jgi:ATP/ADP translocase